MSDDKSTSSLTDLYRWIKKYLVTGFLVVSPLVVTLWLLWKSFSFLDGILASAMNTIVRDFMGITLFGERDIPGLGLIALLMLLTAVGFAARNVFGQWLIRQGRRILDHIPLVNKIYKAIEQISKAIFSGRREVFKQAVLIEYPREGLYCIAIMTADTSGKIQESLDDDCISVFLPTTPNPTSGYLLFVPKKDIIKLDMSVEDALQLVISGGTLSVLDKKS